MWKLKKLNLEKQTVEWRLPGAGEVGARGGDYESKYTNFQSKG